MSYRATILADSPIAYWRLGEAIGAASAVDESGNGRTGTYIGGVTLGQVGALTRDVNKAVTVTATQYVDVPDHASLDGFGDFSIEFWMRPTDGTVDFQEAILKNNNNAAPRSWEIYYQGTTKNVAVYLNGTHAAGFDTSGDTVPLNAWTHLVLRRSGSSVQWFINGVASGSPGTYATVLNDSSQNLRMGRHPGGTTIGFTGSLDEVALYSVALTAQQVAAHYAARLLYDYATFLTDTAPTVVVLVEVQPAEVLGPWTLDSGVVYKVTWPKIAQTAIVVGGLYRRLDGVREDGASYTATASIAACQALVSSYFYDAAAELIYVHTSTGSSPNVFEFLGAWFSIFLSTRTVTLDGQPLYQPLVSGLPTIESEMPDPLFGAAISSTGDLSVANTDGVFDQLSKRWIWRNKSVTFRLGSVGMAYADFATVAVMRINGLSVDDETLVLQLEDMGSVLNQSLPESTWTSISAEGTASGVPQALVFGTVFNCPCAFLGHDAVANRDIWGGFAIGEAVTVVSVAAIQRSTGIAVDLIDGVHYVVDISLGLIRVTDASYFSSVGFDIIATLTDVHQATFGGCAHRLLNRAGEFDANIDLAAFDAADLAAPQRLSRYVDTPTQIADLMRELEQSCLGQVYRGLDGRWTCRLLNSSLPGSVALSDVDFVGWDVAEELAAVLNTVRVRYDRHPFQDQWRTTSASSSDAQYMGESFDSHQVDTWLTTADDAYVLASRLLFLRSAVPANITFEERGLTLMQSMVGDLVSVTRARAPVGRTGRYEGQLLRILKLTKSLGTPSVSGILGDLSGHADNVARLTDFSLAWSTATAEQKAVYGFLADSNGYIDPADMTTRNLKVMV